MSSLLSICRSDCLRVWASCRSAAVKIGTAIYGGERCPNASFDSSDRHETLFTAGIWPIYFLLDSVSDQMWGVKEAEDSRLVMPPAVLYRQPPQAALEQGF